MSEGDDGSIPARWEMLGDRLLNDCRVWSLRERIYRHPESGKQGDFFYLDSRDWVIVVARTKGGDLILVRQFRCGSDDLSWELPGGIIDAGEDPVEAGLRELLEETGYRAQSGRLLGHCQPNPAILNNHCHFVFAEDVELDDSGTDWDEHEEIEIRLMPEQGVMEWVRENRIGHALALNGLLYYRLDQGR